MTINLYNSYTASTEKFVPIKPNEVKMYVCGPTVYSRPHLGNLRSAIVFDVVYRLLLSTYPNVVFVRNITDIDDKIISQANKDSVKIDDLTQSTEKQYNEDIAKLGCMQPTQTPKATQHIYEMISMISSLIESGHAYENEGSVLFKVASFENYGKLSKQNIEQLSQGDDVVNSSSKYNSLDFVLWKPAKQDEPYFESPWGNGRPGWHIECSAMAKKYLGSQFDIHGGGVDLKFPHHENEIAQSFCCNKKLMAKYWLHNGFLTWDGEKMSKSLGNIHNLPELIEHGYSGQEIRYFMLSTHYRKPLDFNNKALNDAKKAIKKFNDFANAIDMQSKTASTKHNNSADSWVYQALCEDVNTPLALTKLHEAIKLNNHMQFQLGYELLGFNDAHAHTAELQHYTEIPDEIVYLAKQRMESKLSKNWAKADEYRNDIEAAGYKVIDISKNEYQIEKNT